MQNSRVSLGNEDCAEGNNVDLRRVTEVSVGAHQMLYSEMGHLESLHKELETSREHAKKLLQGMDKVRELTEREHELMTRELHTSTEAREKLSEMISELRASAKEERESVMKELESYREARKQLSQEMIELRASMEREKELLTRELKAYKEAGKQGMSERAAASPSNETDASSPTLLRKFTGLFVSSKSTRLRKHSQQKTQQKEFEVTTEASTERKKESFDKEKDNSGEAEKQLSEELNDSRDQFKGLMEDHESVKETENLGATSPSNECVELDASRSTLFKKFKGFFVSSKSRRQRGSSNEKKQKELKVNTKASLGTQLLAGPSHEDYHEYRQGHNEITDLQDILENDEVETGTTAFVSDTPPRPRKKTKSRSTNDATNCSQDRESDNEGGMVSTSRAIDNHVRQNHFEAETSMQFNQTTDRRQSFHNDRALQHFSGYYNAQCSYFIGPQIYADQLPYTGLGQLLPMRPSKSLPSLLCERDIIPPRDSEIKIELQPKSQKQQEGTKVIFELKVQQPDKYSYQWLKDGAELLGKCDATLILDHVELREFGWYTCRVNSQENSGINCESSRVWLDVVPKVQSGTRLKTFQEVDITTCDRIAFFLDKQVPYGVGGTRQAAAVFGMNEDMIGALGTCKTPGQEVIEFVKATKPDITVYTLCKQLKGDKMRRIDIAKILENHLTIITESEV